MSRSDHKTPISGSTMQARDKHFKKAEHKRAARTERPWFDRGWATPQRRPLVIHGGRLKTGSAGSIPQIRSTRILSAPKL